MDLVAAAGKFKEGASHLLIRNHRPTTTPEWSRGENGKDLRASVNNIRFSLINGVRKWEVESGNNLLAGACNPNDRNQYAIIEGSFTSPEISINGLFQLSPNEEPIQGRLVFPANLKEEPSFFETPSFWPKHYPKKIDTEIALQGLENFITKAKPAVLSQQQATCFAWGKIMPTSPIPLYVAS